MEFRLLGPVELWARGQRQNLGWAKERCVLAVLLMSPGRPIPVEILISKVWGGDPPEQARDGLYSQIARLRGRLHHQEGARLTYHAGAYLLETDPERVDYHRFKRIRTQALTARDGGDPEEAVRLLGEAVRLWRDKPLGGVRGDWAAQTRRNMEVELLGCALERIELQLGQGRNGDLIPELNDLVARFPLDEKPVELLMLTLQRNGRSSEALLAFEQVRQRLDAELGAPPSPRLREIHQGILLGEPGSVPPARRVKPEAPPNDLPRDVRTFTGRARELEWLTAMVEGREGAVCVLAVNGMPGVGKTALAVHLAHRLTDRYPDGQIFLDLHGHDAERDPIDPTSALGRVLRALRVPDSRIPGDLDGRAALWRAELSHRKVLLVLDNALGNDQIRHLLPGTPGCLVVVTSRRMLSGVDDSQPLPLDVLAPSEAADLLVRIVGSRRGAGDVDIRAVADLCGHLPLAVQLAGSRLRHRAAWSFADLAARLGEGRDRLKEIRAEDRCLTAAFDLSLQGLDARQRTAFIALSLHPGADFGVGDAAALLGEGRDVAESLLDDLHDHHLVAEPRRGRYRFHDLIGEFAEQLVDREPGFDRGPAIDRLLAHHLAAADQADRLLFPQRSRIEVTADQTEAPEFTTGEDARAWLSEELDNLVHAARYAAEHERAWHCAMLAHVLVEYLESSGHWREAARLHESAVEAWLALGKDDQAARALADLSKVRWRAGEHEAALDCANRALAIQRERDDRAEIGALYDQIGLIHWHRSEFDVAFGYYAQARPIYQEIGNRKGLAEVANHSGIALWHLGRYAEGVAQMQEALNLYAEVGNLRGQQMALNNLGYIELSQGNHDVALDYYQRAAEIVEMNRQHRAVWLNNVATVHERAGRLEAAFEGYREALAIYREIGDRRGEMDSLINVGACYVAMGRDAESLIHFQKGLNSARELGEKYEECRALRSIGEAHHRMGRPGLALEQLEESLAVARSIGATYLEAQALDGLGRLLTQTRGIAQAEPYNRQALELYEYLGAIEADSVRSRLMETDGTSGIDV
ncbi:tetratricopeptide repeat protein [Spirillospora sp. CA-294931]|uniref:AfsR/SARP family transcriptional regulator n=1 Tax=Spirillospora sp. CA-294931 TaxID=3240042 RepID=UPI003D8DDCFD